MPKSHATIVIQHISRKTTSNMNKKELEEVIKLRGKEELYKASLNILTDESKAVCTIPISNPNTA